MRIFGEFIFIFVYVEYYFIFSLNIGMWMDFFEIFFDYAFRILKKEFVVYDFFFLCVRLNNVRYFLS